MNQGDRIKKTNSTPEDGHQDGATGTIVEVYDFHVMMMQMGKTPEEIKKIMADYAEQHGSTADLEANMYTVFWDDMPGLPVMVSGTRLELLPADNEEEKQEPKID